MAKASSQEQDIDFEAAMGELEGLVETLERGELGLEDSIKQFERGIELTRLCQRALGAAEQRVLKLAQDGNREILQTFELPDEGSPE